MDGMVSGRQNAISRYKRKPKSCNMVEREDLAVRGEAAADEGVLRQILSTWYIYASNTRSTSDFTDVTGNR